MTNAELDAKILAIVTERPRTRTEIIDLLSRAGAMRGARTRRVDTALQRLRRRLAVAFAAKRWRAVELSGPLANGRDASGFSWYA